MSEISDQEFSHFRRFIFDAAGIALGENKKVLVTSRLASRLQRYQLSTYSQYLKLLASGEQPDETQTAIDLLTTNETYFFREPRHFDFLREQLGIYMQQPQQFPLRIWSAAGSTGEEAYSIAMVLEDRLRGRAWELLASDISARVLERARTGHYPMERARHIPLPYLQRFCLKGQGKQEQTLLIDRALRNKVRLQQINLNAQLPPIGQFEFIFLRNVLIYFNEATKREVIARMGSVLKPGGWLFIGHSETLHGVSDALESVAPAIYRKP